MTIHRSGSVKQQVESSKDYRWECLSEDRGQAPGVFLNGATKRRQRVLHNISACRGAMDALMAEVIEGHIRFHILPVNGGATGEQTRAADDLVTALRAYLE